MTAGTGLSQRFSLGEADSSASAASEVGESATTPAEADVVARGAVAQTLFAPGLAPWLGARAGLGKDVEVGVTGSGRTLRLDGRRAFGGETTAMSIGIGLAGRVPLGFEATETSGAIAGIDDHRLNGLSLDLPILVGYRSSGDVIALWGGLRPGFEAVHGRLGFTTAEDARFETTLRAHRIWIDGIVGAMVGLRPLWVGVELDFGLARGSGRWDVPTLLTGGGSSAAVPPDTRESGPLTGFTVTPAAVLRGRFD